MVKIGNVELAGRLFLAPMAGVTDASFRLLCRKHGAALATSEMISSKALMYQDGKTKTLLVRPEGDTPLAVQIFGSDPSCMAEAACKVIDLCRPEIIDINMGCPVGKVVKSGDGSALMKTPDLAAKIIESVVHAVDVPVTVKFRKGFDKGNINAVPFAEMCESAGAAAIAVRRLSGFSPTLTILARPSSLKCVKSFAFSMIVFSNIKSAMAGISS